MLHELYDLFARLCPHATLSFFGAGFVLAAFELNYFFAYTEECMSKECIFCGKKPQVGNLVSHSNIKTKRRFNPNLQRVRHQFPDGSVRTLSVCTRCLRSGAVTKPTVRKQA